MVLEPSVCRARSLEVVIGAQRGTLFGNSDINELVECNSFGGSDSSQFLQQAGLKTQSKVAFSHRMELLTISSASLGGQIAQANL